MVEHLPVHDVLPEILRALAAGPNLVLAAPPGAGKTTALPLALLDAPWREGRILMLEPRRLAARAAATRMAKTLEEPTGQSVGYRIRGASQVSRETRIEVITEGILTAMLRRDPGLEGISAVIFDEVHERSIHSDLGLALCLEIQEALRPDLRLIAMSATLETAAFARIMPGAHVIESAGQSHPVEMRWLDRPRPRTGPRRAALARAMCDAIAATSADAEGDVLAFLPGAGEIRETASLCEASLPGMLVQTLYGAMPFAEQQAVLNPSKTRRVVLASAIAETSLTVPGVRAVVDSGLARRMRVDRATGLSRLVTEPVSRAEAAQRAGRAGRLGPGLCQRLWTRGEEGGLPAQPPPEILSADLTSLALDLAAWGTRDPAELRFIDQPPPEAMSAARDLLGRLGALDQEGRITSHGRALSEMPLHPRLAHMLVRASEADVEGTGALMAAVLSERPLGGMTGADLRTRLEAVLRPPPSADRGHITRIREEARRLSKGRSSLTEITEHGAELAALAYPDRIAQRREGDAPRFLLANGRGAVMDATDALATRAHLIATDLEDGREARIRVAIPIALREIRRGFADRIVQEKRVFWSTRTRKVVAEDCEMLDALVLDRRLWRDPPEAKTSAALIDGIRDLGLSTLPFSRKADLFRRRAEWLRSDRAHADALPDFSDEGLMATIDDWLTPHLSGCRQIADLERLDLTSILKAMIDWPQQQLLDREVPSEFRTPLGSAIQIDYAGEVPAISVRLQELFGLTAHPVVGGRPLLVHLLSPAQRPVQSTMDLPGFWAGSYADVRKDMRARYPKHPWPEDPMAAAPTRRAKPRRG